MPSQPPIPPLLTPYLAHSTHSAQSLTLITSVLAATSNWLLLRYLHDVLLSTTTASTTGIYDQSSLSNKYNDGDGDNRAKKIILVSFLRDWTFWKAEGKRLGLDLQKFVEADKLRFVDGLTGLFDVAGEKQQYATTPTRPGLGGTTAPVSGRPIPMRAAGLGESVAVRTPAASTTTTTTPTNDPKQLHISGSNALHELETAILSVIKSITQTESDSNNNENEQDILLIIDQPDFILASVPGIDADDMSEWLMGLQLHVRSTIVTTSADFPLVHNAAADDCADATPLERHHAAFVVGLAHRASMVLQLRTLDTGAAKDVSGVLRVSKGGGFSDSSEAVVEKEVLYFVQRDGGVRVFGRGEA